MIINIAIARALSITNKYNRIEALRWDKFFSHKKIRQNCSQTNASSGNMHVDSLVLNFVNLSHAANILSQRGKFKSI